MPRRAMWKGEITLGRTVLPVKLYAAVEDTAVHFHLLHDRDGVRVEQRIVHRQTGEEIPRSDLRRGFPLDRDTFVVLEEEELKALEPEPSRAIEIASFVPEGAIPAAWFERPYHVGPDGDDRSDYAAFVRALLMQRRQGIARWVMRGKRYTGALRARADHLALIALRDREEVLELPALAAVRARASSVQERRLAEQLIGALEAEFDPDAFPREHQARVRAFIEKKAKGKAPRLTKPRSRKPTVTSLENVLLASVRRVQKSTAEKPTRLKERKSA